MTPKDLTRRHPALFHMAVTGSWSSIKRHGLLSTESLLNLFEIGGRQRAEILTRRRPNPILIEHPKYGRAVIRDQKTLNEAKLAACLQNGLTTSQWLRMLNSKVFFWVDSKRLTGLRDAREYRHARQLVLVVNTAEFVEAYADRIMLSDRNTGTTSPMAHPRGRDTFQPLRRDTRSRVVELTVDGGVPDVCRFVTTAMEIGGGEPDTVLYTRS